MAETEGYDEVNLNVGCPSDRVQSGTFGAVLMKIARTWSPSVWLRHESRLFQCR